MNWQTSLKKKKTENAQQLQQNTMKRRAEDARTINSKTQIYEKILYLHLAFKNSVFLRL